MTPITRSASSSSPSARTSTPAARAAPPASSHASDMAPASLCADHRRPPPSPAAERTARDAGNPRPWRPRVPWNLLGTGARSAALGRRQLLPLALLDALPATALEECGDRGDDSGEEHEQEEL